LPPFEFWGGTRTGRKYCAGSAGVRLAERALRQLTLPAAAESASGQLALSSAAVADVFHGLTSFGFKNGVFPFQVECDKICFNSS